MRKTIIALFFLLTALLPQLAQARRYTVVISLDGYRWDYPQWYDTPFINFMAEHGVKAGLITYAGDLLKTVFAVVLIHFLFANRYPDFVKVLELYAGFGVVLGHNFPFYLGFQGGKGIACTSGVILAVCPPTVPVSLLIFIGTVIVTRYVSLGSILVVTAFLIQVIIMGQTGFYLKLEGNTLLEFYIVTGCFVAMAVWRHRENIRRLWKGTENKLSIGRKE